MAIIQVQGNVGNADYRISPTGVKILTVSIADNRWNYKDEKEETVWIRAVWFGDRAEKLANSITKAKIISVTGKEAYKIYEGKLDRTIEPLDHQILAFKKNDSSTPQHISQNTLQHTPPYEYPYDPPPPTPGNIPYY